MTINAARFEAQNLRLPFFCAVCIYFFSKGSLSLSYIQLKLFSSLIFVCLFVSVSRVTKQSFHFNIVLFFNYLQHTKNNNENSSTYVWFPKSTMHICSCALTKIRLLMTHTIWISFWIFFCFFFGNSKNCCNIIQFILNNRFKALKLAMLALKVIIFSLNHKKVTTWTIDISQDFSHF